MIPEDPPQHGLGHNQPPDPIEHVQTAQRDLLNPRQARRDEIAERLAGKEITDRVTAGDAADLLAIARGFRGTIGEERRELTDPYRQAANAGKNLVDEFLWPIEEAEQKLRDRLTQWQLEEDARIKAQQAEQEQFFRREETPAQPPPPPARPIKKPKIRGDYGATASLKDEFTFEVVDVRLVPDIIMNSPTVHEAIVKVAKSMAKHVRTFEGLKRIDSKTTEIR